MSIDRANEICTVLEPLINSGDQQGIDIFWMKEALKAAEAAAQAGEIPVGALIVQNQTQVIGTGQNNKESIKSPLGHAEICAIEQASQQSQRWRLTDATLYSTLEPCVMCAGAIVHARLKRVVYAASDPKAGAVESLYQILHDSRLNHQPEVVGGVLAQEATQLLKHFFSQLRQQNKIR